jgi:RecA-family ATPase
MTESSVPSRRTAGNGRKVSTDSMSKAKADRFKSLSSAEFSRKNYRREFLIEGVLVNRQFCILGGPKKSLKTSLQVEMAVALATATPFLGQFTVPTAKRVAIFSGETSPGDLQDLARRVCAPHGTSLEKLQGVEWIHNLPRLWDEADVKQLRAFLEAKKIDVVFVDSLYLCLLSGQLSASASNLYATGPVLRRAAKACLAAGATPVFLHHTTKIVNRARSQSKKNGGRSGGIAEIEPPDLDDLAFTGPAEAARQWLLLARSEPYDSGSGRHDLVMAVGGSAGHSSNWSLRVDEGVTRRNLRGRHWRVNVAPFGDE